MSFFSKCSCECTPQHKYVFEKLLVTNGYTLVQVKYIGATNYEGRKILLYKGNLPDELDPHFCEHHKSPVARFEPTELGWELALCLMKDNK